MIVQTFCDTCGMEYDWPGVTMAGQVFCCAGCAAGGPCTCRGAVPGANTVVVAGPGQTVVAGSGTTVVTGGPAVVPADKTVIIE